MIQVVALGIWDYQVENVDNFKIISFYAVADWAVRVDISDQHETSLEMKGRQRDEKTKLKKKKVRYENHDDEQQS